MEPGRAHATAGGAFRRQLLLALALPSRSWWSSSLVRGYPDRWLCSRMPGTFWPMRAALPLPWLRPLAQRPPSARRTFGWQRLEILAAAINAVLLLGVAGFVLVEGVRRLGDPPDIEPVPMLAVAVVGLVGNGVAMALLHRGQRESMNVRGAYLEVFADLLGSAAVVVAAAVVLATGWYGADPVASILIGLFILPRTWSLLREALEVLLEATPPRCRFGRGSSTHDRRRRGSGRA